MTDITGKTLKKARHIEDMTQDTAANILGIHRSYLSQIENGKVIPSSSLQKKINQHFKDSISKFLFEV